MPDIESLPVSSLAKAKASAVETVITEAVPVEEVAVTVVVTTVDIGSIGSSNRQSPSVWVLFIGPYCLVEDVLLPLDQ